MDIHKRLFLEYFLKCMSDKNIIRLSPSPNHKYKITLTQSTLANILKQRHSYSWKLLDYSMVCFIIVQTPVSFLIQLNLCFASPISESWTWPHNTSLRMGCEEIPYMQLPAFHVVILEEVVGFVTCSANLYYLRDPHHLWHVASPKWSDW